MIRRIRTTRAGALRGRTSAARRAAAARSRRTTVPAGRCGAVGAVCCAGVWGKVDGCFGGRGLEVLKRPGGVLCGILVDDHDHSALAMFALRAVDPHGSRGVDEDGICGDCCSACSHWHEATVDTCNVRHHTNGHAGRVECGLCDCVVTNAELELYHIANGGSHVVRRVCKGVRGAADFDNMNSYVASEGSGGHAESGECESGELHSCFFADFESLKERL